MAEETCRPLWLFGIYYIKYFEGTKSERGSHFVNCPRRSRLAVRPAIGSASGLQSIATAVHRIIIVGGGMGVAGFFEVA